MSTAPTQAQGCRNRETTHPGRKDQAPGPSPLTADSAAAPAWGRQDGARDPAPQEGHAGRAGPRVHLGGGAPRCSSGSTLSHRPVRRRLLLGEHRGLAWTPSGHAVPSTLPAHGDPFWPEVFTVGSSAWGRRGSGWGWGQGQLWGEVGWAQGGRGVLPTFYACPLFAERHPAQECSRGPYGLLLQHPALPKEHPVLPTPPHPQHNKQAPKAKGCAFLLQRERAGGARGGRGEGAEGPGSWGEGPAPSPKARDSEGDSAGGVQGMRGGPCSQPGQACARRG